MCGGPSFLKSSAFTLQQLKLELEEAEGHCQQATRGAGSSSGEGLPRKEHALPCGDTPTFQRL
jgi:hypothetical protein